MMRLCYRGNTYYRSCNLLKQADSSVEPKYRGVSYDLKRSDISYDLQPNLFQYRGVSYLKAMV